MALRDEEWFRCFGCSPRNPRGLALEPRLTGSDEATCDVTFDADLASHPGIVHGGIVSTAVDDLMANLLVMQRRVLTFSTVLRTRFLSPVLTGRPYRIVARITGEWDGGFRTEAEVAGGDGRVCASATATYAPIGADQFAELEARLADHPAAGKTLREVNGDN